MTSFYDELAVGFTGERIALPPGIYGGNKPPKKEPDVPVYPQEQLKIVSYLGTRPTKDPDLKRHGFLVAAANGTDGTAFYHVNLKDTWLQPAAIALAFNVAIEKVTAGLTDPRTVEITKAFYQEEAVRQVAAANTPEEAATEATEKQYKKILEQIRINVGQVFRLQDWAGQPRNPAVTLSTLIGTQFTGRVETSKFGDGSTSEVTSIFSKPKSVVPSE